MEKANKTKAMWIWYRQTSTILGIPTLFALLFLGFQKFVFTATCMTASWKCEYALGADMAMAQYMGELLAANPGTEIVAKPKR